MREEKNMLKTILDLDEITVGSIMIPRKDIFSLSSKIKFNTLIKSLKKSPHSRIPIWKNNPENIIGLINIRSLKIDLTKNQQIRQTMIVLTGIGIAWSLLPGISLLGHLAGFIAGALLFLI